MSSRHLIDPELAAPLDLFPMIDLSHEGLPAAREALGTLIQPMPEGVPVRIEQRWIEAPEGRKIRIFLFTPERPATAATGRAGILHIHGGGYVMGTPELNVAANVVLANELDCVIASVDYRLAPETPHPGPVEDCYAGLEWLHDQADTLGVDRGRIAVSGESAGGGLAAGLALLARDRGKVPLVHQHLIYPMLDDRTCTSERSPYVGEFVWNAASNHFGWSALLGCAPGSEGISLYAAAARAEDLAGLPATFLMVGTLDLFLEEDIDYARRLIIAGVPTELHVYPGAYHAFNIMPDAQIAVAAQRASIEALRRALLPK